MPTTRNGAVVVNGASTQGRQGHRNLRKSNSRTKDRPHTRQYDSRLPRATVVVLPPTPPDKLTTVVPRTRNSNNGEIITCSHFGKDRKEIYPRHFFCEHCTFFDQDIQDPTRMRKIQRHSRKYRCRAHHRSWAYPTHLFVPRPSTVWLVSRKAVPQAKRAKTSDENEEDEAITMITEEFNIHDNELKELRIRAQNEIEINNMLLIENVQLTNNISDTSKKYENLLAANNKLRKEFDEMNGRFQELSDVLEVVQVRERKYFASHKALLYERRKINDEKKKIGTHREAIEVFKETITKLSKEKNRNVTKLANNIINNMWETDFIQGMFIERAINKVRHYFRNNVFSPENLLFAMDMNGGQLSMQGIDILRTIETKGNKYCRDSMFPSTAVIKRATTIVDKYASTVVPFHVGTLPGGGEYAKFEPKDVVKLMIRGFKLEDESQIRAIKINQAIDGAQITTRTNHTTIGFKMADKGAKDPRTGELIYASEDQTTLQSKNNCFPTMIAMKKETKEIYQHFTTVMQEMSSLTKEETARDLLGCHPILAPLDSDMSATWKLCGRGGAMKVDKRPCHICDIHDSEIEHANLFQCARWCKEFKRGSEFKCYHKDFLHEDTVKNLRDKMTITQEEMQQPINEIITTQAQSAINCTEDPRAPRKDDQLIDPRSIFFDDNGPEVTAETRQSYQSHIFNDLVLRNLSIDGTAKERQARLQRRLIQEYTYMKLHDSITHAETGSDKNFLLLIDYVPCILHMENRTGLKILLYLLQEGLTNSINKNTYTNVRTEKQRIKMFLSDVEDACNTVVWGTPSRPTFWKVPFNMKEKKLDDITLDNNRTRKLMQNLHVLLHLCVACCTRYTLWEECVMKYTETMVLIRKKDNLSDAEINEFQMTTDDFYQLWMRVAGKEGITNYFHLLGSGHMAD